MKKKTFLLVILLLSTIQIKPEESNNRNIYLVVAGLFLGITSEHLREAANDNDNKGHIEIRLPDWIGYATCLSAIAISTIMPKAVNAVDELKYGLGSFAAGATLTYLSQKNNSKTK